MKNTIIAITGPTASGKTDLAIRLAKLINAEIICCDSRQIYKEFNIGTAKPTIEERKAIPHHLFDLISPTETFSAEDFYKIATKTIEAIQVKGKNVIVVGGTGFYFRILLEGLMLTNVEPNIELRKELTNLANTNGKETVHNLLKTLDKNAAEKIHPNNLDKVIRAIEISKSLNKPMSETGIHYNPRYNVLWVGVNYKNRDLLYQQINKRVDMMIETGLANEAKYLFEKYGKIPSILNTIGYKEFLEYFDKQIELNNVIEKIKQNTRHYAKRQLTWFNANQKINWFFKDEQTSETIIQKILELYKVL